MSRLNKLLYKREKVMDYIKRLEDKKKSLDEEIIELYDKNEISEHVLDKKIYRKIINKRITWDASKVRDYISTRFGRKVADKVVETVTKVELVVDENELGKLITAGKVKNVVLNNFINVTETKPYLRVYNLPKNDES